MATDAVYTELCSRTHVARNKPKNQLKRARRSSGERGIRLE